MKKRTLRERLSWTDAWVFASLGGRLFQEGGSNLEDLICTSDVLNRAIVSIDELRSGLKVLYRHGMVEIIDETICVTEHGRLVFENGKKRSGGLFSVVNNMEKALNTPRIKHPLIGGEIDLDFITEATFDRAYRSYWNKATGGVTVGRKSKS